MSKEIYELSGSNVDELIESLLMVRQRYGNIPVIMAESDVILRYTHDTANRDKTKVPFFPKELDDYYDKVGGEFHYISCWNE